MECVTKTSRASSRTSGGQLGEGGQHRVDDRGDEAGVVEVGRSLSSRGAPGTAAAAAARFSRYCRQQEYDE